METRVPPAAEPGDDPGRDPDHAPPPQPRLTLIDGGGDTTAGRGMLQPGRRGRANSGFCFGSTVNSPVDFAAFQR